MKDRRMKALVLFTILSLLVCLIASSVIQDSGSSYAATSSLKWTQISIPTEDDMQLYPDSDIGPMAVTSDGVTVFAAVQNESSGDWDLFKSTDAAFSWQATGLADAMAAIADTSDIIAVLVSPSWSTDGTVFAATEKGVYYSDDRGGNFDDLTAVPGTSGAAIITSLALGREDGNVAVAVGTSDGALGGDVYILNMGVWNAQSIGAYDVLAVSLSPSYSADSAIITVVVDATSTITRTKRGTGGWGVTISDATFKDQDGLDFVSYKASIGLPSDYRAISQSNSMLNYFVGLSANGPGPIPLGDVFSITGGWLAPSTADDLDVRGDISAVDPSETNIWSIAVNGPFADIIIIAGTEIVDYNEPPTPHGQSLIYNSTDGGMTWSPSQTDYLYTKQPTGEAKVTVAMTPYMAYAGTFGNQSAISASSMTSASGMAFSSWNQRGLIDTVINEVTDATPSEGYFSDGTMFITTMDVFEGDASLWRTQTEGRIWERLYCSMLTINTSSGMPDCIFNVVHVTGDAVILAELGGRGVIPSIDGGRTFRFDPWNPTIGNTPADITAFTVEDESTYYAGGHNGAIWRWTDDDGTWVEGDTSVLGSLPITVVDLFLYEGWVFAGTDYGSVIGSYPDEFEFGFLGTTIGGAGDIVSIVRDPYDDNFLYVGIQGSASVQGIWRYNAYEEGDGGDWWNWIWEQIADGADVGDISSIVTDDENGILYALSSSTGTGWRSVNPTNIEDDLEFDDMFEEMNNGLGAGDSVLRGLKIVTNPTILFAVGGPLYTQIWTTSDEIVRMKLLAPEDGSVAGTILEEEEFLGRAVAMLEWKEIEGAKKYEVKVAYDEAMDSPVDEVGFYDEGTVESDGLCKVVYPWLGTRYYWSVRVIDPYTSQWSEVWSFVTPLGPAPSVPVLLSPEAGTAGVDTRPLLQWNSSVAATGYELILSKNCDWANPVLNLSGDDAVSDTAYQITFDLAENTDYCWKVRGINEITHSPWSDSLSFTTGYTEEVEEEGLPVWVWVIIVLSVILMLAIVVLIFRSRAY